MKIKKAYTMVEVVIVLAIIGTLSLLGILSIKKGVNVRPLHYAQTYSSLRDASYNVFLEKHEKFGQDGGVYSAKVLCQDLTSFINAEELNCDDVVDIDNESFQNKVPSFVASNGARFWITNPTEKLTYDSYNNKIDKTYWVIFTDINPSQNKDSDVIGEDIVPFIITNYGEVIPQGAPLEDPSILKTEVRIYHIAETNGFKKTIQTSIPADNFLDAKQKAWGNTVWAGNPLSYNFSEIFESSPKWLRPQTKQINNQCYYIGSGKDAADIKQASTGKIDSAQCETCEYNCNIIVVNKKAKI